MSKETEALDNLKEAGAMWFQHGGAFEDDLKAATFAYVEAWQAGRAKDKRNPEDPHAMALDDLVTSVEHYFLKAENWQQSLIRDALAYAEACGYRPARGKVLIDREDWERLRRAIESPETEPGGYLQDAWLAINAKLEKPHGQ